MSELAQEPTAVPGDRRWLVGDDIADTRAPDSPIGERWGDRKFSARLVSPANRRRCSVIVVGTGLAGGAAAATLGEAGYRVRSFCFQDTPRRAHSIAAQGGINAAKNYRNDGDSIHRLFYDTVKGGDFRSRESNVHRLAEVSLDIIDQCVAQGVPFAREYSAACSTTGPSAAPRSRAPSTPGARRASSCCSGRTQALSRQIAAGTVETCTRAARCSTSSSSTDGRAASSSAT